MDEEKCNFDFPGSMRKTEDIHTSGRQQHPMSRPAVRKGKKKDLMKELKSEQKNKQCGSQIRRYSK
jgi:hypothetical protein